MKEKVLLVSSGGLDKSGVPSVLMTVARGLKEEYTFDMLVSTGEKGYFEPEFLGLGGRIFRCPKRRFRLGPLNRLAETLRFLRLYAFTTRLLRENGPYRAIHCNNDFDMAGCVAAARRAGVPVRLCHTHKTWQPDRSMGLVTRAYRGVCRRLINRCATARVGCSPAANASLYGADAASRVLWNPYDERRFVLDGAAPRKDLPLRIAQVGYLCDNKNQLFTLEVLAALRKAAPDARLTFIGGDQGGYERRMRERIAALGLEQAVTLLPPDADIPAVLAESSLLLLPSRMEGFGIVLIEAQAMGLACYASDTVPPETNVGGVTYLPLSAGAGAWAEAILREGRYREKRAYDCGAFTTSAFLGAVRGLYQEHSEIVKE